MSIEPRRILYDEVLDDTHVFEEYLNGTHRVTYSLLGTDISVTITNRNRLKARLDAWDMYSVAAVKHCVSHGDKNISFDKLLKKIFDLPVGRKDD